jgi:T-complex protein 1 subunit theta
VSFFFFFHHKKVEFDADLFLSTDDGVNCIKAACKDARFVAGAGACEIELSKHIQNFGAATPGLDQYAIKKFAESLEIVPRILAENAGKNATEVLSALFASHAAGNKYAGVNVEVSYENFCYKLLFRVVFTFCEQSEENYVVENVIKKDILDHLATKKSAIRLGADAAITVLRVDQIIMSKAAGGPKPRG